MASLDGSAPSIRQFNTAKFSSYNASRLLQPNSQEALYFDSKDGLVFRLGKEQNRIVLRASTGKGYYLEEKNLSSLIINENAALDMPGFGTINVKSLEKDTWTWSESAFPTSSLRLNQKLYKLKQAEQPGDSTGCFMPTKLK